MADKPDLMNEDEMTPEGIAANTFFSREEKLERLNEMKAELGAAAEKGDADLSDVESRMRAINAAIASVKKEQAEDDSGIAMGRAPGA